MELTVFVVDAFASKPFEGNPAAVILLEDWLPDGLLLRIAAQHNLSETAFLVKADDAYHIRWFSPKAEVALCGHATLAAAHVLSDLLGVPFLNGMIVFTSLSGELRVKKESCGEFTLDFPLQVIRQCAPPEGLLEGLGESSCCQCFRSMDYLVVLDNEAQVASLQPNFHALMQLDLRGVIVTAASKRYDFIFRMFAPKYAIDEDPVTGSAVTQLLPYWADVIKKPRFHTRQISIRGGDIRCYLKEGRAYMTGTARRYLEGKIFI